MDGARGDDPASDLSPALDGFFSEMADLNAATDGEPPARALKELGARWDCVFTALPSAEGAARMVNEPPP